MSGHFAGGGGRMLMRSKRSWLPLSVLTVTDLNTMPLWPAMSTLTRRTLFVPGGNSHGRAGNCGWVQPHEAWASRIVMGIGTLELVTVTVLMLRTTLAIEVYLLPEIRDKKL